MLRATRATLLALALLQPMVIAQQDEETAAYVASRRKVMDDPARPLAEREGVAAEVAATLDRARGRRGTEIRLLTP